MQHGFALHHDKRIAVIRIIYARKIAVRNDQALVVIKTTDKTLSLFLDHTNYDHMFPVINNFFTHCFLWIGIEFICHFITDNTGSGSAAEFCFIQVTAIIDIDGLDILNSSDTPYRFTLLSILSR
jgi:putative NIF3 family GTP cyclohydrolase 1 type 2